MDCEFELRRVGPHACCCSNDRQEDYAVLQLDLHLRPVGALRPLAAIYVYRGQLVCRWSEATIVNGTVAEQRWQCW